MAPQTSYLKEHQGIVPNSIGQLSSSSPARLWGNFGGVSQAIFEDYGHLKPTSSSIELLYSQEMQFSATKPPAAGAAAAQVSDHGLDKVNMAPFPFYPGDSKNSVEPPKTPSVFPLQPSLSEFHRRFEVGFGQPLVCANYPYMNDQHYGILSAYGPQIPGRIMLPMSLTTDEGPIYVNAKQYHGIIRRRQSRAKALMRNKLTRTTRKPYMHESRHLHAMRRPRGSGGRFLNTKNPSNGEAPTKTNRASNTTLSESTGSQGSVVLQSPNYSQEVKGRMFSLLGSEVSSMFSREVQCFQMNHLGPSMESLVGIIEGGHGLVLPKWGVAAAESCCDLCV